jgi:transposase IS166 family protein
MVRRRAVPVCEAPGARALHMATGDEWHGGAFRCPTLDVAGRHRLAQAREDMATGGHRVRGVRVRLYCSREYVTLRDMSITRDDLPNDVESLKELVLAGRAEVEHLKLIIAKLKRLQFGRRSEKLDREIEQLELRLEELQVSAVPAMPASEHKPAAQVPVRRPLPEHLPRTRNTRPRVPAPTVGWRCARSARMSPRFSTMCRRAFA